MSRVLHLVNAADSQSIPWEVGLRLSARDSRILPASFYAASSFPPDARQGAVALDLVSAGDLRGVGRLWRLLRRERPTLIHVHHTASSLWALVLGRLAGGCRLVKTEHNDHRFQP
ncbi:MAG: glycosyltransferase, partial [Phycisphaeraceae bacterium]|nr:glycosyltransferase [Phycisphaeraceae bacterium]